MKSLQPCTTNNLINWNNFFRDSKGTKNYKDVSRIIKMFLSFESLIPHLEIHPKKIRHKVESIIHNNKIIEWKKW